MRLVLNGALTDIVDGDTIEIEVKRRVRVRVIDCWCAETRTKDPIEKELGLAARQYAQEILSDQKLVEVDIPLGVEARFGESMSFDRVLGNVKIQRGDYFVYSFAQAMITAGHAFRTKKELEAHIETVRKARQNEQ